MPLSAHPLAPGPGGTRPLSVLTELPHFWTFYITGITQCRASGRPPWVSVLGFVRVAACGQSVPVTLHYAVARILTLRSPVGVRVVPQFGRFGRGSCGQSRACSDSVCPGCHFSGNGRLGRRVGLS